MQKEEAINFNSDEELSSEQKYLYSNTTSSSTEVVLLEFKKVTISLPKELYSEGMELVNKGLFSNFSDLVRSGIRNEFKELHSVAKDFDEKSLYKDNTLLAGVAQSKKEAKNKKGKLLKTEKETKNYLKRLK